MKDPVLRSRAMEETTREPMGSLSDTAKTLRDKREMLGRREGETCTVLC